MWRTWRYGVSSLNALKRMDYFVIAILSEFPDLSKIDLKLNWHRRLGVGGIWAGGFVGSFVMLGWSKPELILKMR